MARSAPQLRQAIKGNSPGTRFEQGFWDEGIETVVGLDEVGRGAWAGPLTIGAVVIPKDRRIYKIRDSKMLTESEREILFDRITDWAESWAIGHASVEECDELGMSDAQRLAATRALDGLGCEPQRVLLDGNWDFVGRGTTTKIIKGDATCLSIAAASILAKVTRDRIMRGVAPQYPEYVFDKNKGYPCPIHKRMLRQVGPTEIHRHTWAFIERAAPTELPLRRRIDTTPTLFDDASVEGVAGPLR